MSYTYKYGVKMCQCMIDSLPMIEERLRALGVIKKDISGLITQGAYSGAKASAGTHNGGGAIDVSYWLVDTPEKRAAWRNSGVAMWHRRAWEGNWAQHGHGVWIGCPHLQGAAGTDGKSWVHGAQKQVIDYRNGLNGLVSRAKDQGPRVAVVTWRDALKAWNKQQEEDMAFKPEDKQWLAEQMSSMRKSIINEIVWGDIMPGLKGDKDVDSALVASRNNAQVLNSMRIRTMHDMMVNLFSRLDKIEAAIGSKG